MTTDLAAELAEEDRDAEIARLLRSGVQHRDIAARLETSCSEVTRVRKQLGLGRTEFNRTQKPPELPPRSPAPIYPLPVVHAPADTFRCGKYSCTLTARACVIRQGARYTPRIGGNTEVKREERVALGFQYCASGECAQGNAVAAALKGQAIEPTKPKDFAAQFRAKRAKANHAARLRPEPEQIGGGMADPFLRRVIEQRDRDQGIDPRDPLGEQDTKREEYLDTQLRLKCSTIGCERRLQESTAAEGDKCAVCRKKLGRASTKPTGLPAAEIEAMDEDFARRAMASEPPDPDEVAAAVEKTRAGVGGFQQWLANKKQQQPATPAKEKSMGRKSKLDEVSDGDFKAAFKEAGGSLSALAKKYEVAWDTIRTRVIRLGLADVPARGSRAKGASKPSGNGHAKAASSTPARVAPPAPTHSDPGGHADEFERMRRIVEDYQALSREGRLYVSGRLTSLS